MARHYSLQEKIAALNALAKDEGDLVTLSKQQGIKLATLRRWHREETKLRAEQAQRSIMAVRQHLADKAMVLVDAIDDEKIAKAPLNQITSALGVLIDRYMKLEEVAYFDEDEEDEDKEKTVRIEYVYDGSTHMAPPWANPDYAGRGAVQGGGVRSQVWQNGASEDAARRKIVVPWDEDLVASPDIPDGEPGLARFEGEFEDEPRRERAD